MATLTIRQLDDAVYDRLKARARFNRRSLEAEVRLLLEEQAQDIDTLVDDLEDFHRRMVARHGILSDSLDTLREIRRDG